MTATATVQEEEKTTTKKDQQVTSTEQVQSNNQFTTGANVPTVEEDDGPKF
jgi:hypothetical protein